MTTGSCMCGAIALEYTGEPNTTALCHCKDCQKWTGAAYTANVLVPRDVFKITKGSPKHYNMIGASGKNNDHFFCGDCGSSLYTALDVIPDAYCIKSGVLDDPEKRAIKVEVEFYTKDRVEYAKEVQGAKQVHAFG